MKKVFIDGINGIVGSTLFAKLKGRRDIELITLADTKDVRQRQAALNQADIVFICLPETQGKKAIEMVTNPDTAIIDFSGSAKLQQGWVYGFPDLYAGYENLIRSSNRIAMLNPHAVGFIALVRPLIDARLINASAALSCFSVIGHSVGGKKMAEQYKNTTSAVFKAHRQYGLTQTHKGLAEMVKISGLKRAPIFSPVISSSFNGVGFSVFLFSDQLEGGNLSDVKWIYADRYQGPTVKYNAAIEQDSFLSAASYLGRDSMEISVTGNNERIVLNARYDNLGKGSVGAAIECMNIMMGVNKTKGLDL